MSLLLPVAGRRAPLRAGPRSGAAATRGRAAATGVASHDWCQLQRGAARNATPTRGDAPITRNRSPAPGRAAPRGAALRCWQWRNAPPFRHFIASKQRTADATGGKERIDKRTRTLQNTPPYSTPSLSEMIHEIGSFLPRTIIVAILVKKM